MLFVFPTCPLVFSLHQDETDESRRSSVASVSQASDVKSDKEKPGSRRTSMVPEKQTKEVTLLKVFKIRSKIFVLIPKSLVM